MDAIISDLSRDSDENCATLAKKVLEMARSAVANKTTNPSATSNDLAKVGIKVSVSTLRQDSQRPVDTPLTKNGPPPFLLRG